jgi:membrane protein DedA with SNARE-associated domain
MPDVAALFQSGLPELSMAGLFVFFLVGTFVSEDAACLLAGAAASSGRISLGLAMLACFLGIFIGDVLLYGVGRAIGPRVFETRLVSRFVSERAIKKAASWLGNNAGKAVFLSRFVSGLRLPTYLMAGATRSNFAKFTSFFLLAAAIWTPVLVGSAAYSQSLLFRGNAIAGLIILAVAIRAIFTLSSRKRRRLFVGRLKRVAKWEFWPIRVLYLPVVIYVFWLGIRHRDLTAFTAANPALPAGGFKGESKSDIYHGLLSSEAARPHMLKHTLLPISLTTDKRLRCAWKFIDDNELQFPIVLKPDAGERGKGVMIVRSFDELESELIEAETNLIVQEFCGGEEVSIFYYGHPSNERGWIFSITEKRFPTVTGDGRSTLDDLILGDHRAVCLAKKYFEQNAERLGDIPATGEQVKIVDIGTHSRGAVFVDGGWLRTDELEAKIDEICRGFEGFYFGRFDIRADSFSDLRRGVNFRIIELNGVTSESTNIYDPRYSLSDAYRILFRQWRLAFEIGLENIRLGAQTTSVFDLIRLAVGRPIRTDEPTAATLECA